MVAGHRADDNKSAMALDESPAFAGLFVLVIK